MRGSPTILCAAIALDCGEGGEGVLRSALLALRAACTGYDEACREVGSLQRAALALGATLATRRTSRLRSFRLAPWAACCCATCAPHFSLSPRDACALFVKAAGVRGALPASSSVHGHWRSSLSCWHWSVTAARAHCPVCGP